MHSFSNVLHSLGLRASHLRVSILETLNNNKTPLTIKELCSILKVDMNAKKDSALRKSIYSLIAVGLVREVVKDSKRAYTLKRDNSNECILECIQCKKTFTFIEPKAIPLLDKAALNLELRLIDGYLSGKVICPMALKLGWPKIDPNYICPKGLT